MADASAQGRLFSSESEAGSVVVNARCLVRVDGDQRVVVVAGVPIAHFSVGDRMAEANAMVGLVEHGWAEQLEVARAFGRSARTVRRYQRRYDEGGLGALGRAVGYPRGRPRGPKRDAVVGKLKAEGLSNRQIAQRLGVDEKAIRKRLRRLGWKPAVAEQTSLPFAPASADPNVSAARIAPVEPPAAGPPPGADPNVSAPAAPPAEPDEVPSTLDRDPADRSGDRLLAYLGLLDDAAPLFGNGAAVAGAGVLLAVPALVASGVLGAARAAFGTLGPAFYGLRTTIIVLCLMALRRIQRVEALKEHSPTELGRVLGLDRAPEVKTLRRKIARLAASGGAEHFGRLLAHHRVAQRGEALGFLYVDGHVRVYFGKRRIPKTHAARIHAVAAATTDYWVNDQHGDPLLVITAKANAGLVAQLPPLLDEIRKLVGDRRPTIVFDRGGWSPKLFVRILAAGFDILTYRKGQSRSVPRRCFTEHRAKIDGRPVTYELADEVVTFLDGKLELRQVTRLKGAHQTPVLTSRRDLPAVEVAYRMFGRWRQENFFKYLREEYLLDALVDYQSEPDDPARDVPNPKWIDLDEKVRNARAVVADLQREAGATSLLSAIGDRTKSRTRTDADRALDRLADAIADAIILVRQRNRVPRRVPVAQITDGTVVKLATQRKHLTDLLKMVAYQAESDLLRTVAPHYKRTDDEGRTLIQTALASAADLDVTNTEIRVTLAPLSSPHRTRAVAALCDSLNATRTRFPGTRLQLHFTVGTAT